MGVRARSAAGMLVVTALASGLSGCDVVRAESCVSWVWFDTPQNAYDEATLVVRGEVTGDAGTREIFDVEAPVHRVEVLEVLKGDDPGSTIDVASTPLTCMGDDDYPNGDPLELDGDVILFLDDPERTGWRLTTPEQGVLAVPDDGVLPFEVEDR